MIKNNSFNRKSLLTGASLIALSIIYSGLAHADDQDYTQSGNCSSLTTATCYGHDGITPVTAPADIATYCLNNGALYSPSSASRAANGDPRGQTCTYTCNITVHVPHIHTNDIYGGGGDGGGDGRGGDTTGDGQTDNSQGMGTAGFGPSDGKGEGPGGGDGGDGGGCFVTTAVVNVIGEEDHGPTLTRLRHLRDNYTIHNHRGTERIQIYYDIAPMIVRKINRLPNSNVIWQTLYNQWIQPIAYLIEKKDMARADYLYSDMVFYLTQKYIFQDLDQQQKRNLFLHAFKIL